MFVKQGSAGILCRCIYCHGIFKLFSYKTDSDATSSEFECDCGRVIKIEEQKLSPAKRVVELSTPSISKEVAKR